MPPEVATHTFPAMGGTASVSVVGRPALLRLARRRLVDLEAKWSRFIPDSEVSRLNARRGAPVAVSADTRLLLGKAAAAWAATGGAFDPTVLDSLVAWGYDRDLAQIDTRPRPPVTAPSPGLGAVEIDEAGGTARLGGVAGFDPGGIGKGLAADLAAAELAAAGAEAVLVNVCGDLRIAGAPADGWVVGLEDPLAPTGDLLMVSLTGGALATSSDRRRRWRTDAGEAHHLIDPCTGHPATTALAGVSVLAGEAWWAEALTKAVLVGGLPVHALAGLAASGIARTHSGAVVGTLDLLALRSAAA